VPPPLLARGFSTLWKDCFIKSIQSEGNTLPAGEQVLEKNRFSLGFLLFFSCNFSEKLLQ